MTAKCMRCGKHVLDCQCGNCKVKDYCAGCEHPEVIRMLIPKLDELEKRVEELEKIIDKSNLRKCRFHVDDEIDIKVF